MPFTENNGETGVQIIAALLEEMKDLKGKASFESCETKFRYSRCIRHGIVEAPHEVLCGT